MNTINAPSDDKLELKTQFLLTGKYFTDAILSRILALHFPRDTYIWIKQAHAFAVWGLLDSEKTDGLQRIADVCFVIPFLDCSMSFYIWSFQWFISTVVSHGQRWLFKYDWYFGETCQQTILTHPSRVTGAWSSYLLKSASNIFLWQLLGEFYDLKSKLFESKDNIVNDIQGKTIEEKPASIIKWFMHNTVADKPRYKPSCKSKRKRGKIDDKEKQKAISIELTQ